MQFSAPMSLLPLQSSYSLREADQLSPFLLEDALFGSAVSLALVSFCWPCNTFLNNSSMNSLSVKKEETTFGNEGLTGQLFVSQRPHIPVKTQETSGYLERHLEGRQRTPVTVNTTKGEKVSSLTSGYSLRTFHGVNYSNFIEDYSIGPTGQLPGTEERPRLDDCTQFALGGSAAIPHTHGPRRSRSDAEASSLYLSGVLVFLPPSQRTTINTRCEQVRIWTCPSPLAHRFHSVVPYPGPHNRGLYTE